MGVDWGCCCSVCMGAQWVYWAAVGGGGGVRQVTLEYPPPRTSSLSVRSREFSPPSTRTIFISP
eukprot:741859-Prorocentrum_minimum.AAC.1